MQRVKTAILGGSGLYKLDSLQNKQRQVGRTPYGDPSAPIQTGTLGGNEVVFLARHGLAHNIPPHRVNYRANIWALKAMGVEQIIAIAAVGGIHADLQVGDLILPHQLLDYTHGRAHTFFDGEAGEVQHIDFSFPYDATLIDDIAETKQSLDKSLTIVKGGVYAATQGPRLETAAEIDRIERDGGTIVGMTGMPEAALAREAGLTYACLALVVNPAAGRSKSVIDIEDIEANLKLGMQDVLTVLSAYFGAD